MSRRRPVPREPARAGRLPYGERQYNAEDIGGHRWTFSQSIARGDPADCGRLCSSRSRAE